MSNSLAAAIREAVVARALHLATHGDIRNLLALEINLKQAQTDVAERLRKAADILDAQEIRAENLQGVPNSDDG